MRRARITLGLTVAGAVLAAAAPVAGAHQSVARSAELGAAPAAQRLDLVLPLVADTAGLERYAMSIATPGSPDYARHQPLSRLSRWFGASAATRARVLAFLQHAGATHLRIDATGLFADATITVGLAERAFGTELARFRGTGGARFIGPIAASAASAAAYVPAALSGLVRGVVGLDTRPLVSPAAAAPIAHAATAGVPSALPHSGTSAGCAAGQAAGEQGGNPQTVGFTPNQYTTAYDFTPLQSAGVTGQGETIALIEIDGFRASDIDAFAQCFGLRVPELSAFGVGSVRRALPPGGETTLDLEVLDAAAPGLKQIDIFESNADAADTLRAMTAPLELSGSKQPQVVSASLGLCEPDVVGAIGSGGFDDVEAALAAASATGITYLASTGDDGSADCSDQNGNPIHHLAVNYPASSWWVTGVGGTNFGLSSANQILGQVVWNDGSDQPGSAGGGGYSSRFGRPDYQDGATTSKHRVVPDVSMLADIIPGYAIYCTAGPPDCDPSTPWMSVGGTSAATPLLAGGFALVDQELHANGREDLGLANPLLYRLGESLARATVFDGVSVGSNDVFGPSGGLGGSPLGCCSADAGFNAASGWGSVNVANFEQQALLAQPPIVDIALSLPGHQHAISSKEIKATVASSGPCLIGAYAEVKIGSAKPFEVDSKVVRLAAKGSSMLTLKFSKKQLSKLRAAPHQKRTATVHGVLLNSTVYGVVKAAGESIQSQTGGKKLSL